MISTELSGQALWRRQCARNVMDCYALAMEMMAAPGKGPSPFEALVRLMVGGAEASERDGRFYGEAARLCRECVAACEARGAREKTGMFRIYAAIFDDVGATMMEG